MAFNIVHWLRSFTDERSDWPCQYRMVALALGRHANKDGECHPSERLLEREAYVSRPTVIRTLRLLEKAGWSTRDPTHGKVSRFKLVSHVDQYLTLTGQPETPVSLVDHGGQREIPVGGQPETPELLVRNSVTTQGVPPNVTLPLIPTPDVGAPAQKRTPRMKVAKTDKEPDALNPSVQAVFAGLKEARGYQSPIPAGEAAAIRAMLRDGHDAETILACWNTYKETPFWADKELTMPYVAKQINAWKHQRLSNNGASGGAHGTPGRRVEVDTAEARRWSTIKRPPDAL